MKYMFTLLAIVGYSFIATAQINISPKSNNEQKFPDSLQKAFR